MHNLKSSFDKFFQIAKSTLAPYLLEEGNFARYRNKPKFTNIELVALAITAESLGIDIENLIFSKLKTEYLKDFPSLSDLSNYNRRKRKLLDFTALAGEPIAKLIHPINKQFILDFIPIPICQNPRIKRSKISKEIPNYLPARGYHASYITYYYGFKAQLVTSILGVPITLGLTPANVHDVHFLDHLDFDLIADNQLIADMGYLSKGHQTKLFEQDRIQLITHQKKKIDQQNIAT